MRLAALALLLVGLVAVAYGSSHSEAPGTARQPQADATDFYMFRSYEPARLSSNFVTFLFNTQGLQSPYAGPNYFSFSDAHFYEIYIDNDYDAVEDQVFQFIYGNELGGSTKVLQQVYPADFDCAYGIQNKTLNAGIEVPVDSSNNVDIALKFGGKVTSTDQNSLNWFEYYSLNYIRGNRDSSNSRAVYGANNLTVFTKPFDYAGEKTFPDYEAYANQYIYNVTIPFCDGEGRVFVGQRHEPFYINLGGIFDLINFVPIPGFPGAISQDPINNDLANKNIGTFALEVETQCLVSGSNTIIGAWTAIRQLKHDSGGNHVPGSQVSRLGNPLVNELVIGLRNKFAFNAGDPKDDVGTFGTYVLYPTLPYLVNVLFGAAVNAELGTSFATIAPKTPRLDLTVFVTGVPGVNQPSGVTIGSGSGDMLRLDTAKAPVAAAQQDPLGVIADTPDYAGFPNGRRPGDDAVDIALQVVVAGKLCQLNILCNASSGSDVAPIAGVRLTDGAPISATDFQNQFPYLNTPLPGAKNGGKSSTTGSPASGIAFPSLLAIILAIILGFVISFGFFA